MGLLLWDGFRVNLQGEYPIPNKAKPSDSFRLQTDMEQVETCEEAEGAAFQDIGRP